VTPAAAAGRTAYEVSVAQLAWLGAGGLFVALRVAGLVSIPVGGPELDHLSGAWQAHAGNTDDRFVPTLFQAVAAWLFSLGDSEVLPRLAVVAAQATVPLALYRLRPSLGGEAGALIALVLLALDPVSILLGSTAWAGGWDVPLVLWLLVLLDRARPLRWLLAAAGLAMATAGPLVLPFLIGPAAVRLWKQQYPPLETVAWAGGGVLLGWALAATSFGFGLQDPLLPPLATFAEGFEAGWAGASTGYLALLYSSPLMASAAAAAGFRAYVCWRDQDWPERTTARLTAFALSLAWVLVAAGSNDPVPLAAVGLAGALVLGPELPAVLGLWQRVNWRYAAPALAGLFVAALVAEAYVVDWARVDRPGRDREQLIVTGLVIAALACAGLLASNRGTVAALLVPVAFAATVVVLSGATGVAFGGPTEPLPSPVSTVQGREVRDIAVAARDELGGPIVIHADFQDIATWPFRGSGTVVFASRVPADAAVVVWPVAAPAPDGYAVVDGNWSFREHRHAPDGGFLDYLRWLTDRNSLQNTIDPVAVYLRTAP